MKRGDVMPGPSAATVELTTLGRDHECGRAWRHRVHALERTVQQQRRSSARSARLLDMPTINEEEFGRIILDIHDGLAKHAFQPSPRST
ncbi:hypothetical protein [Candidatus Amarobacter glycogenicus]|uniref:hypothetical protein n=1 Tax=Candidatus Amarobacter glycogenicus TaxID=3140699 RepID=UPI003134D67E|nr:hypothetical protein [Dehalococcoidia bacterium]